MSILLVNPPLGRGLNTDLLHIKKMVGGRLHVEIALVAEGQSPELGTVPEDLAGNVSVLGYFSSLNELLRVAGLRTPALYFQEGLPQHVQSLTNESRLGGPLKFSVKSELEGTFRREVYRRRVETSAYNLADGCCAHQAHRDVRASVSTCDPRDQAAALQT